MVHLALFRVLLPEHPASTMEDDITTGDTIQHQYQKDSRTAWPTAPVPARGF
jgi:hypothetical protein